MSITQDTKTYLARLVRRLTVRGRSDTNTYSCEGYQNDPNEPTQTKTPQPAQSAQPVQRAQHFGFLSELPDGGEVIVLAINGGASNRVAIAEIVTDNPTINKGEVLLWTRNGQRVLLDQNGNANVLATVVNLGDMSGSTLATSAVAQALLAFSLNAQASTDATLVSAAATLNRALTGFFFGNGTVLLSTMTTSKTKAS